VLMNARCRPIRATVVFGVYVTRWSDESCIIIVPGERRPTFDGVSSNGPCHRTRKVFFCNTWHAQHRKPSFIISSHNIIIRTITIVSHKETRRFSVSWKSTPTPSPRGRQAACVYAYIIILFVYQPVYILRVLCIIHLKSGRDLRVCFAMSGFKENRKWTHINIVRTRFYYFVSLLNILQRVFGFYNFLYEIKYFFNILECTLRYFTMIIILYKLGHCDITL